MRLIVRLIGSLILCVLLVSVSSSYYQVQHEKAALRSELAKRGEVLADSLQENVERLFAFTAVVEKSRGPHLHRSFRNCTINSEASRKGLGAGKRTSR